MSTAFLDPESSTLADPTAPIVLGLTAAGQPLIHNLVLSTPAKDCVRSSENECLSPLGEQQLENKSVNNQESILVLNGVSAGGEPIVQGIVVPANITTENNCIPSEVEHQTPEEIDLTNPIKADPTVTPNNSEIGDSVFYIHGGLTNDGLPLIQGVVLLPEHYPEAPDTKTPPPSEAGEGDYPKSTEREPSPEQPPENPERNPNPEQDPNPQNPPENIDPPVDNVIEEEFVKIEEIRQGDYCCDQRSHDHLAEPVKIVDLPQAPPQPNIPSEKEVSLTLANILLGLSKLKMVNQPQYTSVVDKLRELEDEMKGAITGLPPDPSLTDLISKILAAEYPDADLQIIVSSSRKTTTTKSFYETEAPGMVGLDPSALQDLHRKLMQNISSPEDAKDASTPGAVPPGLHVPDVEVQPDSAVQKKEVHEEGFSTNDGSEVVSKKMTRVVTTSQSAVSGVSEQPQYESRGGELIRLKVNQQLYDGNLDPTSKQIRLIPIKQIL